MKNVLLRGNSHLCACFVSAWRSFVAFAAFVLVGGTLFAAPDPFEADTIGEPEQYEGYVLSWSDEFNGEGYPDPANWGYETGYVRNSEAQEYTKTNAVMSGGALKIIACENDDGVKGKYTDEHYTSTSLISKGLRHFKYGRYEFRARMPISGGAWPSVWMMGTKYSWPACGEIDIAEYYKSSLFANLAWGNDNGSWSPWGNPGSSNIGQKNINTDVFFGEKHADWFKEFHVWRMDWTKDEIVIYVDGVEFNRQSVSAAQNAKGYEPESEGKYPFREPQYLLLNVAMGGTNGGTIDNDALPMVMEVDYVRCYRLAGDEHRDEGLVGPAPIDMTPGEGSAYVPDTAAPTAPEGYHLAWNDEFDTGDMPSADNWNMEEGSTEYVANGVLVMPLTNATGALTWGGLESAADRTFTNGVLEIRARLPMARGSTVQLATSTDDDADPYGCVEPLDFRWSAGSPLIGGWVQWDAEEGSGDWFEIGFETLRETNETWAAQFHVWRYVVDGENVTITLDGRQLYSKPLSAMGDNPPIGNPEMLQHLNFWMKTDDVSLDDPLIGHGLEIDYVRVYEPGDAPVDPAFVPTTEGPAEIAGYTLAWNEEFNTDGSPDTEKWVVTNPDNAVCTGGALVMTAEDGTKETDYRYAGLQLVDGEFSFGHYEIRAKMPFGNGIHGAFQFDGSEDKGGYPTAGCFDLIDSEYAWNDSGYFSDTVALWTTWETGREKWSAKDIKDFAGDDEEWADKYHVWTIDWDEDKIVLSLDGTVYNTVTTAEMTSSVGYSPAADPENMFSLMLALDKRVGVADVALCEFPQTMEVDYIRYYAPESEGGDAFPKVDDVETKTADEFVAAVKSGSTVTLPDGGDFAWDGNVLKKGDETWATLPDYYTVGTDGKISFAVDAVKPVISAIAADATVKVTVSNAKKGLTYGLLSATTLEGLATATPAWLEAPAAADGQLDIPAGDKGAAGFFKAVVTDAP